MDHIFIPVRPGTKFPTVKGWSQASLEEATCWWDDADPDSNVAMRLDGLVCVDCDSHELARWFLNWCEDKNLPCPISVRTPRGIHFYWRLPAGETCPSFVLDAPYEGDIRVKSGPGQYALVPPSRTEHGVYEWTGPERPAEAPLAVEKVIRALQDQKGSVVTQAATEGASGGLIPSGMRNTALTGFAGLMRRYGFDTLAIERVLVGLNRQLTEEPIPDSELAGIIRSSDRWEPEELSILEIEDDVTDDILTWSYDLQLQPPAEYLWRPYLPAGRLVLLDGDEGIGKGMFCAWAARNVVNGQWGEPGNVLWAAAEDDPEEDIKRRLMAVGIEDGPGHAVGFFNEWPSFPKHIDAVKRLMADAGNVKLVVLDPGRSFIHAPEGVTMSFNDEAAIRPAMERLNRLAKETGATVVFVHHWNKDSQGSVRSRAGGTKAFTQVVRHRVTVARVGQGDQAEWAMEVSKSNIAQDGHLRSYRLTEVPELESARFEPGEALSHDSLGAWIKDREAEHRNESIGVDYVDLLLEAGIEQGRQLTRPYIEALGVPRQEVPETMKALEAGGYVRRQKHEGAGRPAPIWVGESS